MKKRLLLVPHGRTDWNDVRRFQGQSDIPMNALGRQQAQCLARSLRHEKIVTILASDLSRASETAAIVAGELGLTVQLDPRLRELNFGGWEGLTWQEIAARDGAIWHDWEHGGDIAPPGGESLSALAQRLTGVLGDIPLQDDDGAMLVVAHRISLRVLICLALGMELRLYRRLHLAQTSISELVIGRDATALHRLNDTYHLRAIAQH